jgi:PleD family two-component response regulator
MEISGRKRCAAIVADEDPVAAETIREALDQLRCDVRTARTPKEVLVIAREEKRQIVIVSASLRGLDAGALCRELHGETPRPRIVVLVDRDSPEALTAALEAGADDALAKPLVAAEVMARLRTAREIVTVEDYRRHLEGEGALLAEITTRSSLHGWRYLRAQLGNEFARARRFAHSLSLVLVEVGGSDGADRDVRSCYHLLADTFRARVDGIARHDERTLALVLPETDLDGATRTAERMRERLLGATSAAGHTHGGRVFYLGVTALDAEHVTAVTEEGGPLLLEAATEYLHDAMSKGPNAIAAGPAPHA